MSISVTARSLFSFLDYFLKEKALFKRAMFILTIVQCCQKSGDVVGLKKQCETIKS